MVGLELGLTLCKKRDIYIENKRQTGIKISHACVFVAVSVCVCVFAFVLL